MDYYLRSMRSVIGLFILALVSPACTPTGPSFDEAAAVARGKAIAGSTFRALSERLLQAMQDAGPAGAVEYCSLAALPLVDSLAATDGVRIKRTSDRIRALHDRPDDDEQRRLNEVLALLSSGTGPADIPSQAVILGDSIAYYQPILIAMPACLKCHGKPGSDIDSLTMQAIARRYSFDNAIGYSLGDFRGLWSIRWKR